LIVEFLYAGRAVPPRLGAARTQREPFLYRVPALG
jgi:hypothetical protein